MKLKDQYDYIILGAGSAGCVLANRLSACGQYSVLIVEAGPMDRNLLIHIPAGVYDVYRNPNINWNYESEAETELDNRKVELPRGKVIGGSSSINSMVYMRGHPIDYDRWQNEQGLKDWQYANCLPYFKRCESSDRGENTWRGGSGPLGVTRGSLDNPLFDAFIEAGSQSGQGVSDDLNGYQPEGVARLDSTRKHGRRCSAAVAHLKPALARSNLTLICNALTERINIENSIARSINIRYRGKTRTIQANREILLSCGAIKSPQLLMLSGIGPVIELSKHGISPRYVLPGVGQNLQDHAKIQLVFESTKPVTFHKATRPLHKLGIGLRWLTTRSGLGASNIWEAGGLIKGNHQVEYPNLQYHYAPIGSTFDGRKIKLQQAFTIQVDLLRPASKGFVALHSDNPDDRPAAHFNYLSNSEDIRELAEGHEKMQELIRQPAFDAYRGQQLEDAAKISSRKDLESWIHKTVSTDFHPCGTCKMGIGEDAVVDHEFKVYGIENLRVVDASVMPDIISGNLNAPTQMMAERAADVILGKPLLASIQADFHFKKHPDPE
ncbi:MAG: choline dehydrogenase [Gammaproteobacteria bacterium]|jgi:choline dehydrogenase